MGLVVNLEEFSELCGVTPETMRGHIRAVEGGPAWLIERGDRGRGYKIETDGGIAWWRAKREEAEASDAEHQQNLAQLRLELLGDRVERDDALALSGKQRRDEYAAAMDRIRLRRTMGELVERAEIEPLLSHAAVEARRRLMLVPGEYAALAGLDPAEVKPLEEMIARVVDEFAAALVLPAVVPHA